MEFAPICLECNHLKKIDYCPFYNSIPHEIKNREINCRFFSGGEYGLFTSEARPKSEEK